MKDARGAIQDFNRAGKFSFRILDTISSLNVCSSPVFLDRFFKFTFILFPVELNPYAAHVYFNRANLYASLRKYKDSEEDYTRGKNSSELWRFFVPDYYLNHLNSCQNGDCTFHFVWNSFGLYRSLKKKRAKLPIAHSESKVVLDLAPRSNCVSWQRDTGILGPGCSKGG